MSSYNILYVCPSNTWGSRERQVLKDLELAREKGYGVFLYCFKDSHLDKQASLLNISVLHHKGRESSRFIKWQKFLNLRKIFSSKKIHLVHCYELNSVWPVSFFLRGSSLVPLIVSINREITKSYRQVWYKALIARADLFLLPSHDLESGINAHLGLHSRKMECLPLGVKIDDEIKEVVFKRDESKQVIGSYLPSHETDSKTLLPLLTTISILNEKSNEDERTKLILFSDKDPRKAVIYQELSRIILDMGLEEDIHFKTYEKMTSPLTQVDLWVALNQKEFVHDFSLIALTHGLPVVVPRTSFSRTLLAMGEGLGESYKLGDARELREKCERIFQSRHQYKSGMRTSNQQLGEYFSLDSYKNQLLSTYQKLIDRRARLHRRRRLRL